MIELLEKIIRILDLMHVPYMLSGSVAMNLYAEPRTTQDIDLIIELLPEDVPNLVKLLGKEFYFSSEAMYDAIDHLGMFNIIDYQSGMKVDMIMRNKDIFEQVKFQNRQKTNYLGIELWIIRLEDLVISKLRWIQDVHSSKQITDISNLLTNEKIDFEYIKRWVSILNLKTYNLI